MEMGVVLVVMSMVCAGGVAQTQTQTQPSCTSVLLNLSPCLDYISGNSSTPSSSCCTQLATVVSSQPQCLCQVLNGGGSSLGLNINQTLALALPSACNIQTPPISLCASPAESPNWNPSGNVPTTDNASSSSTLNLSISLLLLLLAVAPTYASTFRTLLL